MAHSVSVCNFVRGGGVQIKLQDPLRTHAIPVERLIRGVLTTRRTTNPRLPFKSTLYLYIYLLYIRRYKKIAVLRLSLDGLIIGKV